MAVSGPATTHMGAFLNQIEQLDAKPCNYDQGVSCQFQPISGNLSQFVAQCRWQGAPRACSAP